MKKVTNKINCESFRENKVISIIGVILTFLVLFLIFNFNFVFAQNTPTVCCEKTLDGAFCQNTQESECDSGFRRTPTSCDATSFCKLGTCVDSVEGLCMDNTPQKVCEISEGTWIDEEGEIDQCRLGCCLIGNQASFVTLTRCKRLSNLYGLETNFRRDVNNEVACIDIANFQDKGACVFETRNELEPIEVTCKFTTRIDCNNLQSSNNDGDFTNQVGFFKDFLCSADELATNCGPTTETTCVQGKEEVYFKDSCGNPANIYDANKIYEKDVSYWQKVVSKTESCEFGDENGNAGSGTCGNCEYFKGSICSKGNAEIGDFVCKDLNCYNTRDGKDYKNGESWCVFESKTGNGRDPVGSRHFRHICVNGEETVEACGDFRNEICIQDVIETSDGDFIEAACRLNRWTDCVEQINRDDCENKDKRDCYWNSKYENVGTGFILGGSGACLPIVPSGLKIYEGEEANAICSIGNSRCEVTYEKGLIGGKKCSKHCECLSPSWSSSINNICTNLGDCGAGVNIAGKFTNEGAIWKVDGQRRIVQGIFGG